MSQKQNRAKRKSRSSCSSCAPVIVAKSSHPIDVQNVTLPPELAKSRYGKWRALALILVYVLMIVHIMHWKVSGKTMAPLELSEIMKALELGVISPGVIFIGIMLIGSFIFGRFFCSWGCHMLALQDLSNWLLKKLRIRPRAIRSRVLLLAPVIAATYMFLWPQIHRIWEGRAFPEAQSRLITTDFWRDLPGPLVITLTVITCGFLIVFFFGGRGFCTYGCPYGVLFGVMDRFAPGRIRLTGSCEQCGRCTAICTSNVRVHEEVQAYGMVVNPRCMKDLDCVSVCPQSALKFKFGRPSLLRRLHHGTKPRVRYDFSWPEELAMASIFVVGIFTWRGLYDRLPFLMSLALSAVTAYVGVSAYRLLRRPSIKLNRYRVKRGGRLTRSGHVFATIAVVFLAFAVHSSFIQYHRWRGDALLALAEETGGRDADASRERNAALESSADHLLVCERWGLFSTTRLEYRIGVVLQSLGRPAEAERHLRRATTLSPTYLETRLALAKALADQGKKASAEAQLNYALRLYTRHEEYQPHYRRLWSVAHARLGALVVDRLKRETDPARARTDFELAHGHYEQALTLDDENVEAHVGAGYLAANQGIDGLGPAADHFRRAIELNPEAAEAYGNLGDVHVALNQPEVAIETYQRALAIDPSLPRVHFKIGYLSYHLGRLAEARSHLELSIGQDPSDAEARALFDEVRRAPVSQPVE